MHDYTVKDICAFKTEETYLHLIECKSEDFLLKALNRAKEYIIIGEGTNTLFIKNVEVPLIKMAIDGIALVYESDDSALFKIGAGETWTDVVAHICENGFYGLQCLAGIPGTAGAAPVKNIGAYGAEFCDICHSVQVYDTKERAFKTMQVDECGFEYRTSIFEKNPSLVITSIVIKVRKDRGYSLQEFERDMEDRGVAIPEQMTPLHIMQEIIEARKRKLPSVLQTPHAGSFFKNPVVSKTKAQKILKKYPYMKTWDVDKGVKFSGGEIIDLCGLKGYVNDLGVGVSNKHALVIINKGTKNGKDIYDFSCVVQQKVKDDFDIDLQREVVVWGA